MNGALLTAATVENLSGSLLSDIGAVINNIGIWIGDWIEVILANPLIEICVLMFLAGSAVAFLKRLMTV